MSAEKSWLAWCVAVLLSLAGLAGCSAKKNKALAPLSAPSWRIELPVAGFGAASVALPLGARSPRPIVVVLHGAADRAEWQCGSFRGIFGGNVFVVCPQGIASDVPSRFTFGSVEETAAELRESLAALKARFGAHVAPSPIVLVGYGEGATLAAELARQQPSFFARVALVAGDPTALSSSAATIFGQRGGKRVLFFCRDRECDDHAVSRALLLSRAKVAAKAVRHEVGPYLDDDFTQALKRELPWLLEGDARFGR